MVNNRSDMPWSLESEPSNWARSPEQGPGDSVWWPSGDHSLLLLWGPFIQGGKRTCSFCIVYVGSRKSVSYQSPGSLVKLFQIQRGGPFWKAEVSCTESQSCFCSYAFKWGKGEVERKGEKDQVCDTLSPLPLTNQKTPSQKPTKSYRTNKHGLLHSALHDFASYPIDILLAEKISPLKGERCIMRCHIR